MDPWTIYEFLLVILLVLWFPKTASTVVYGTFHNFESEDSYFSQKSSYRWWIQANNFWSVQETLMFITHSFVYTSGIVNSV